MTNTFVDYLNSLHNDMASNQNAIAELAIASPFFDATQVKRNLVEFIRKKIESNEFVILTGHAGDGKTTLLAQLLEDFGRKTSKLSVVDDVELDNGGKLHYVKDFSELVSTDQDAELQNCFHRAGAAILIANTGPLLGSFKRLAGESIEDSLLEAMDSPAGEKLTIDSLGDVYILNIARVDNTDFIKPFLRNILKDEHWQDCVNCHCSTTCPIYFNKQIMSQRFDRAADLIEDMYIWLQEYDLRPTIRQMTAHLTFSITGGLNCTSVRSHCSPDWRYLYLFSNLFFGCKGNHQMKNAQQIRCIKLVNEAGFDRKQTVMDYEIYSCTHYEDYYPESLAGIIYNALNNGARHRSKVSAQQVLKRAYVFFGHNTEEKDQMTFDQIFSEWFRVYLDVRGKGIKPKSSVSNAIYHAIDTLFVGESLDGNMTQINLTLRRNNEQLSNVQLLNGRIGTDDISLKCIPVETISSKQKHYRLELQTGRIRFPLNLPLLNYCCEIHHGIIMTDIDPLLSNGIDSLKAQLLSHAHQNTDDNQVQIVFMNGTKWEKRTLTIDKHSLDH